jgi:hypothetical protein
VIDQCEYANDVLFTDRAALETIRSDLVSVAVTALGAADVLHFLGRKTHPAFAGEVTIDSRRRTQGCRLRFRLKANAVKFYDHANVFRVETTINNPCRVQGAPLAGRRHGPAAAVVFDDQGHRQFLALR